MKHNEENDGKDTDHISAFKGFVLGAITGTAFYVIVIFTFSF